MKKSIPVLLFVSLILGQGILTACSNQESVVNVEVENISLDKSTTSIKVGETLNLSATITPENATNKEITYSSSDQKVATINGSTLTAVAAGSVTVTATANNGKFDSFILNVIEEEDTSKIDLTTLLNSLDKDEYCLENVVTKEKYGLSDVNNVGVNKKISEQALYEIPADDEFKDGKIIDVDSLSLDDISKFGFSELNDYSKLQGALNLAKEVENGKKVKIKLSSAIYNVNGDLSTNPYVLTIDGIENVYFEGNNSIIEVSYSDLNYKGYFNLSGSKNVYFKDITFRQKVAANMTCKVSKYDKANKEIALVVDPEFHDLAKELLKTKKKLRTFVEFDRYTRAPRQEGNFVVDGFSSYTISEKDGNYEVVVKFNNEINEGPVNTLASLQFAQYDQAGATINNSENIYLENLTINSASGMAFTSSQTKNLYLNRFNLKVKDGSNSLMTSCADALHFSLMSGEVKVTSSLIEYSHDDALNIKHGYFYSLSNVTSSTRTIEVKRITSQMPLPSVGDKIGIYNEDTFESYNPSQGYYTVKEASESNGIMTLVLNERMNASSWTNARVTFLSNTPSFTFSNNIVRNKRNRGIIVQVPSANITNNTFMNVGHGSIQAATAMDVYNEATLPQSITIANNKFINNNYIKPDPLVGDISIFAISKNGTVGPAGTLSNANISNNYMTKNGNAAISLRGVGDSFAKDNLFNNVSRTQPTGDTYNTIFHLYNDKNIEISGNYNEYTLDKNLAGITTAGTTSEEQIVLKDNKNVNFLTIDDVGPQIDVSKFTNSISIDGNLADWDAQGIDIELTGATDSEGNEINLKTIENNFKVHTLKMGYNDTGIYFGFDIYDNLMEFKTPNDFWMGDCVELMMSTITNLPNADLSVYKEQGGVLQAAFAPNWVKQHTVARVRSNSKYVDNDSMQVSIVKGTSNYSGEILIPFTMAPEFKEAIDNEKRIDICIICADGDRPSQKRVQAANVIHNVENNKTKTARMAQYLFK